MQRTAALITFAATPRGMWAPDFPWGVPAEEWDEFLAEVDEGWGTKAFAAEAIRWVWPEPPPDHSWVEYYATVTRRVP